MCSLQYATIPTWTADYVIQMFVYVNNLRDELESLCIHYILGDGDLNVDRVPVGNFG